jgi:radical SAM superfamily enzyme YgiQ (UPF0313 family)
MPKVVFLEPKAPNLHIFSRFPLPRLGPIILGTMMKQRGWEVEVFVEDLREIDFAVVESADLVGISTITSTAPRAYALADRIRGLGIPVLLGGPHVTFLADEALEHADFIIRGEGERTLMAFIDAWEKGAGFSGIPNLSYREAGRAVHNAPRTFVMDLDEIPFPDLSLLKPTRKGFPGLSSIPVQTSRGCPFDCSFCSVTSMFGKRYRFRSTENIIAELRRYDDRRNMIFFYDDNFTADRRRAKDLLEAMIREKFKFRWTTQVRADVAKDPELVRLMKKAGCHTLYIGFESVNPESLKSMKKKQTVDEMARAIRVLRKHRINIHGMFVYGFDADDWKTVEETVKFAKRAKLNSTQFLILTPLPGSEFFEKVSTENRIQFRDWALYDAHHVVFRPARLSLFDLQRAQIFSHKKFYSLLQMFKKTLKGKWLDLGIAGYARNLNRVWQKKNELYLKAIQLLKSRKGPKITIDYREDVIIDH